MNRARVHALIVTVDREGGGRAWVAVDPESCQADGALACDMENVLSDEPTNAEIRVAGEAAAEYVRLARKVSP